MMITSFLYIFDIMIFRSRIGVASLLCSLCGGTQKKQLIRKMVDVRVPTSFPYFSFSFGFKPAPPYVPTLDARRQRMRNWSQWNVISKWKQSYITLQVQALYIQVGKKLHNPIPIVLQYVLGRIHLPLNKTITET